MDIKKIDGHRHIVLLEAIAIAGKLNPVKSSHIYPSGLDGRSEQINRDKERDWDRKMSDLDEKSFRSACGRVRYGNITADADHVFLLGGACCRFGVVENG